ncbi:hypothetical protein C0993_008230, partial [Termitomyces sp. T159_Od127]
MDVKLPPLATIPRFVSAADWGNWINPVMALIDHMGLNGHVCPIPGPDAPIDPTCRVVFPPTYPPHHTAAESCAYEVFWRNDNVCSYIITGKLSSEITNSLPPARSGLYNFPMRTAWDLLDFLWKRFSVGSAALAQRVKDSVLRLAYSPNSIPNYVQSCCIAINQLSGTPWDFTQYEKIQKFMDGIPDHRAYNIICEEVRCSWDNNPNGVFDFFTLSNTVLEIDIDVRCRLVITQTMPKQSTSSKSSSSPTLNLILTPLTNSRISQQTPQHSNQPLNRSDNAVHIGPWRDFTNEQTRDGNNRHRANVAVVEDQLNIDTIPIPNPHSTNDIDNTTLSTIVEEEDNDIDFHLYNAVKCDQSATTVYQAFIASFMPLALASITSKYNAILDSGCTAHIIKD